MFSEYPWEACFLFFDGGVVQGMDLEEMGGEGREWEEWRVGKLR